MCRIKFSGFVFAALPCPNVFRSFCGLATCFLVSSFPLGFPLAPPSLDCRKVVYGILQGRCVRVRVRVRLSLCVRLCVCLCLSLCPKDRSPARWDGICNILRLFPGNRKLRVSAKDAFLFHVGLFLPRALQRLAQGYMWCQREVIVVTTHACVCVSNHVAKRQHILSCTFIIYLMALGIPWAMRQCLGVGSNPGLLDCVPAGLAPSPAAKLEDNCHPPPPLTPRPDRKFTGHGHRCRSAVLCLAHAFGS